MLAATIEMIEKIKEELSNLEERRAIKILLAVEAGNRAWGFPSSDSGWDVRLFYIHRLEWYLKIDSEKDSYSEILPCGLNFAGWEFKKALKSLHFANTELTEWLLSPIIYKESGSAIERLRALRREHFYPKMSVFYYTNIARGTFKEFSKKDMVETKKYLSALRGILACEWIKNQDSQPPIEFRILFESEVKNARIRAEIEVLLERKAAEQEHSKEPKIEILNDYIAEKIKFYDEYIFQARMTELPPMRTLDQIFKETIYEVWK